MVRLNRAVAVAEVDGPAGRRWRCSTALDQRLPATTCCPATRADLLRRLGRPAEARGRSTRGRWRWPATHADRDFLARRLAALRPPDPSADDLRAHEPRRPAVDRGGRPAGGRRNGAGPG